jgi:hypothetical protein
MFVLRVLFFARVPLFQQELRTSKLKRQSLRVGSKAKLDDAEEPSTSLGDDAAGTRELFGRENTKIQDLMNSKRIEKTERGKS